MKSIINLSLILSLFFATKSLESNTLSNYQNTKIISHPRVFEPDFIIRAQETSVNISIDLDPKEYSYLFTSTKIKIIVERNNNSLDNIEFPGYLISDDNSTKEDLNCSISSSENYCKIYNPLCKSGYFYLNVKDECYVVKSNGTNRIKNKDEIKLNDNEYKIDFKNEKFEQTIQVKFQSEIENKDISIREDNNNIKLNCSNSNESNNTLDCNISNSLFPYDEDNPNKEKAYNFTIYDLCNNGKDSFKLKVKYTDVGTLAILIIIIIGLVVVVIVSIFIYRSVNKKKSSEVEEAGPTTLLKEIE